MPLTSVHSKRGGGDTKGSILSTRHTPIVAQAPARQVTRNENYYDILGVHSDIEPDELKAAYRQKALLEHPDKGGDQDRFDAILRAFHLLQDPEKRLEYDEDLARAASAAILVEGAPLTRSTGEGVAHKKTAPTAGSKRQKDWHNQSEDWAGEKHGSKVLENIRLALTDAQGPMSQKAPEEMLKDQTEALFEKYRELPNGSKGKQAWVNSLNPKQKQALKAYAKTLEKEALDKAKKWAGR